MSFTEDAEENSLRLSEQRYRCLFENSRDAIFVARADTGVLVNVNRQAEILTGKPRCVLIGMHQSDLHPAAQRNFYRQRFQDRAVQGKVVSDDIVIQHAGGDIIPVSVSASRIELGDDVLIVGTFHDITERKQVEQRLKQFRHLMDESNDSMFVIELESARFLDANKTACSSLGYTREELLSRRVMDIETTITSIERWESHMECIIEDINTTHSIALEGMHRRKDGSLFPVEISSRYVLRDDGKFIVAIARDITERKQHENLLARRERQLAVLAEAGRTINETLDEQQICHKLVNLGRRLVDCESGGMGLYKNGQMCFREYVKAEEIIPIMLDFPPGYGVPGHVLETKRAYLSHDARHDPYVITEIQQQLDFVRLVDTPILGADGNILGCFEMHDRLDGKNFDAQDMEMLQSLSGIVAAALQNARLLIERRQAREQLSQVNRTLRMISDCNQALVRASDESVLLATICQLIVDEGGYMMAWVGESVDDDECSVIPIAQAGFDDDYLQNVQISWADNELGQGPTGHAIRSRKRIVCQDIFQEPGFLPWREQARRLGYAASVAFPLVVDNEVIGALNIYAARANAFHPEEMELLQELVEDLAFGLEVLRHRNTEQTLGEQLRQAQKMEAIGILAGGIAHDFNNMLAGILGTVYLVRKKLVDNPQAQEKLKQVEATGFRAAEVISQLLTFARKGDTHLQALALSPFLKETFKMIRSGTPENIHLTLNVPAQPCTVKGDAALLQQVLLNLVTNAQHAVEGIKQPEIHVLLTVVEPGERWLAKYPALVHGQFAQLSVEDNGCGIMDKIRDKLFDPFFTTKAVGEGTGLGLAMVYGAVQSHDGVIEVDSNEGKGSVFHIWLPLITDCQVSGQDTENPLLTGNGEVLLLADDDSAVRDVSRELLESIGYRVLTAVDGREAVQVFEQHRDEIRLLVFDVVMPQLGGVDAARRIRELAPDIPVVFQTGYGEDQVAQNMTRSSVVTKPADIPALSRLLRQFLDGSS